MLFHNCAQYSLKNEDRCFFRRQDERVSWGGVADGHGGEGAARLCHAHLCEAETLPSNMHTLFADLHRSCSLLECRSGVSLTVCMFEGMEVTCANVGDSHALVITPTSFYWLTESHRLQDNVSERTYLRAHVGHIANEEGNPVGPPRLFPGGLACSRSVGDADCPHIRCIPSVCQTTLEPSDVLLVATDGLWDAVPLSQICRIAREYRSSSMLLQGTHFTDDVSAMIFSAQSERKPSMFRRVGSNSSISSDEESPPARKVVHVRL